MENEVGIGEVDLSDLHVAIYGLGLMGGSLALALRGKCAYLTGIETDPGTISQVRERNVVDCLEIIPGESFSQADLIILATPLAIIFEKLSELPSLHPGQAIVLDLASTKRLVVRAMSMLPARFDPLGGHPMCGKETLSFFNAESDLYHGAPFAFTRLDRTSYRAYSLAKQLCQAIGAHPVWLDADTHDSWVAAISHLPYFLANALSFSTPEEASPLVGSGFRSTTRVAATPSALMRDILFSNQDNLLEIYRQVRTHLDLLESCLATGDYIRLGQLLQQGAERRQRLLSVTGDGGQP